jgi:hypothetical protein
MFFRCFFGTFVVMSSLYQILKKDSEQQGGADASLLGGASSSSVQKKRAKPSSTKKLQLAPGRSQDTLIATNEAPQKEGKLRVAPGRFVLAGSSAHLSTGTSPSPAVHLGGTGGGIGGMDSIDRNHWFGREEEPERDNTTSVASPDQDSLQEQASRPDEQPTSEEAFDATLAPDPEDARRNQIVEDAVEPLDVRVFRGMSRKRLILAIAVIALIAAGVGVALGIVLGKDDPQAVFETPSPTVTPSSAPTLAPTEVPTSDQFTHVSSLVESLFGYSLTDSQSPQFRAAQWMATTDEHVDYTTVTDARFAQRYALAVFYYATGGDTDWITSALFLTPTLHECDWNEKAGEGSDSVTRTVGIADCSFDNDGERFVRDIEFCKSSAIFKFFGCCQYHL